MKGVALCSFEEKNLGGSYGLLVMGGDSCFKGREFESCNRILDGHFFHTAICCQI